METKSKIFFVERVEIKPDAEKRPAPEPKLSRDFECFYEDSERNIVCDFMERHEFQTLDPLTNIPKTCIHHVHKREIYIRKEDRHFCSNL